MDIGHPWPRGQCGLCSLSFREAERGCKSQVLQHEAMKNPSPQQTHSASTFTPGHLVGELNPQTCWGLSDSSVLPLAQAGEGDLWGVSNSLFFLFPRGCGPPHGQETPFVPASQAASVPVPGKPPPHPGRAGAGRCNSAHRWARGPRALALTPEPLPPVLFLLPTGAVCVWGTGCAASGSGVRCGWAGCDSGDSLPLQSNPSGFSSSSSLHLTAEISPRESLCPYRPPGWPPSCCSPPSLWFCLSPSKRGSFRPLFL